MYNAKYHVLQGSVACYSNNLEEAEVGMKLD
jgi:hypothetical protein